MLDTGYYEATSLQLCPSPISPTNTPTVSKSLVLSLKKPFLVISIHLKFLLHKAFHVVGTLSMPANKARPRWGSKTNLKLYQYVYSKSQINQELDWNNIAALMGNERLPKTYKYISTGATVDKLTENIAESILSSFRTPLRPK